MIAEGTITEKGVLFPEVLGKSDAIFTQGWDRTIILQGTEGAGMKSQINETWIYPPSPALGRDAIFEAVLPTSG